MLGFKVLLFISVAVALTEAQPFTVSVSPIAKQKDMYLMTTYMNPAPGVQVPYLNNLLVVGREAVILFDTNFPADISAPYAPMYDRVRAAINTVTTRNVSIIINSHWHPDHTGLNAQFRNAGTHQIIATVGSVNQMKLYHAYNGTGGMADVPPAEAAAMPTQTVMFTRSLFKDHNMYQMYELYKDAHSGGDMVTRIVNRNVVVCGDIFNPFSFPFMDKTTGATVFGLISASRFLLSFVDTNTVLIPSHGSAQQATRDNLVIYFNTLEAIVANVTAIVSEGGDLSAVLASPMITTLNEQGWNNGFMGPAAFFAVVYGDVMASLA